MKEAYRSRQDVYKRAWMLKMNRVGGERPTLDLQRVLDCRMSSSDDGQGGPARGKQARVS